MCIMNTQSNFFFFMYGIFVLITGLFLRGELKKQETISIPILRLGDVGDFRLKRLGDGSPLANMLRGFVEFFNKGTFILAISKCLRGIRRIFGIKEGEFKLRRVFLRMFHYYYLIIPIPAAFMTPVRHTQREVTPELLVIFLVLLIINALGDTLSIKITLHNFSTTLKRLEGKVKLSGEQLNRSPVIYIVKDELKMYFTAIKDLSLAIMILVCVLFLTSIAFGYQIGEYDLVTDSETLSKMLDRGFRFYELIYENYWFKGEDLNSNSGIPGMFILGISTFIPTIFMLLVTLLWTFLLPLRFVIHLPTSLPKRVFMAETAVLSICTAVAVLVNIDYSTIFNPSL